MESFVAEEPDLPKDFNLVFAGEKFPVSKFKLMLHSPKLREIIENAETDCVEFEEKTT